MNEPLETAELLAFARTVEAQSLSRAARELGVPRATLSRRLARIESRLGVRLIHRTTRRLTLTDAGQTLHRHARIVLDAVRDAEASVHRSDDAVRGELRVSTPMLSSPSFNRMLIDFAARYPDVRLDVHLTGQHVDLRAGGYDVVIRAGGQGYPGLVGRTLARSRRVGVASPDYLRGHGDPRSVAELARHKLLVLYSKGEVPESYWPLLNGGRVHVEGHFASSEPMLLREVALSGLGIALLPSLLIQRDLQRGALVPVLPQALGAESSVMVLHLERELVSPAIKAFVVAVVEWAKDDVLLHDPGSCTEYARKFRRQARAEKRSPRPR